MTNMPRLEAVALALPEAERVDVEAWDGHPTFRVRGKSFVFCDDRATSLTLKLPKEEAAAVVASDPAAEPSGYGLGRHGWVSIDIGVRPSRERWDEVVEMVHTSYTLVAPKRLAAQVLAADGCALRPSDRHEVPGTSWRSVRRRRSGGGRRGRPSRSPR